MLMVDRGEVPKDKLDPATPRAGNRRATTQVTGVWRVPDAPGAFTPAPDAGTSHLVCPRPAGHRRRRPPDLGRAGGDRGRRHAQSRRLAQGRPDGGRVSATSICPMPSPGSGWRRCLLGVCLAYHISKGRLALQIALQLGGQSGPITPGACSSFPPGARRPQRPFPMCCWPGLAPDGGLYLPAAGRNSPPPRSPPSRASPIRMWPLKSCRALPATPSAPPN